MSWGDDAPEPSSGAINTDGSTTPLEGKCDVSTPTTTDTSPVAMLPPLAATSPSLPVALSEAQRRSRHNANERRRTNALKTRILQMREEMEALEAQRARLQRESESASLAPTSTPTPPPTPNRAFLDTVALIDQLRVHKLELHKKLQRFDMQNSTYQTIVSEYDAQSSALVPRESQLRPLEPSDPARQDAWLEDAQQTAPIFQRVLFSRPMTRQEAMACVKESYEAIMAFRAERDFESLDAEVLGWCDKRILNAGSLRFMLSQSFDYVSPQELVYKTWNLLTDLRLYRQIQPHTQELVLLQCVTEDCVIVRLSVSSNSGQVHHTILLIARGRIDGGYLITYRSIPLSPGQAQFAETEGNYVQLFNWYMFLDTRSPEGVQACEVTFGGRVQNQPAEYLRYLMMEVVAGVVRWQTAVGHCKFRLTH